MFSFFRKDQSVEGGSPAESLAGEHPRAASELFRGEAGAGRVSERAEEVESAAAREATEVSPGGAAESGPAAPVSPEGVAGGSAGPAPGAGGEWLDELPPELRVRPHPRVRGKRLAAAKDSGKQRSFTAVQRLLLLDSWRRSGLPAGDFATLIGISKHTLYLWKKLFDEHGPAGLIAAPRVTRRGTRVSEITKRTILMLKESHPEWGCERISDLLARGPGLPASASTVARVLHEAGYVLVGEPTRPHPDKERRFERAKPNQLWQTDLFTFMLKRQNRRVYLVAFMDDHSRFIVSYGLHASCSTALVLEALEAGISSFGSPEEVLTDNGPQYITWRGKSQFTKRLEQRGIRQIVARPRRPQTLGKVERFWGTLWREFLETAVFADLTEARTRIGLFIDHYNFQRTHGGIEGLVPADRFFGAASEVARTLKERVAANALDLARHGQPRTPFYVTGQMEGQPFSVHAEGPRLILTRPGQSRQEVELVAPATTGTPAAADPAATAASSLPRPVCPEGSPSGAAAEEDFTTEGTEDTEGSERDDREIGGEA